MADLHNNNIESSENSEPMEPSITHLDDKGDIRLIVSNQATSETKVFIVSSKAMSMACDAWNAMLNGHFKESQPSGTGQREIELLDDDPEALGILLSIVHLRFNSVPRSLEISLFQKITILTDKYDATHLLGPWCPDWLKSVPKFEKSEVPKKPNEFEKVYRAWEIPKQPDVEAKPKFEDWLWIMWELGQEERFESLALGLVKTIRLGPDGECLTASGKTLDSSSDFQHIPPGILESIMEVRKKTVTAMLEYTDAILDRFFNAYASGKSVCSPDMHSQKDTFECDSMVLGSLTLLLRRAGLTGNLQKDSSAITKSINELYLKLDADMLKIKSLHDFESYEFQICENRLLSRQMRSRLLEMVRSIPSPLQEVHRRHLQHQAKKLRLC
ncbi:hypothetical protein HDK90DRAFT_98885 [Phyllosticta capitalensis]|uniref:Nuclear pore protein n=1 Tax=Phyllosticta capitalensis TaxID=121624 RepID=A0ABR1YAU5_9PEZI